MVCNFLFLAIVGVFIYVLIIQPNPDSNPPTSNSAIEPVNIQSADDLNKAAEKVRALQQNGLEIEELHAIESSML